MTSGEQTPPFLRADRRLPRLGFQMPVADPTLAGAGLSKMARPAGS